MTTPVAGWYDDPWSAEQYRYWDGNAWTPHVAPKAAPAAQPPGGQAPGYGQGGYGQGGYGQYGQGGQYGQYSQPTQGYGGTGTYGPPAPYGGYGAPVQTQGPATGQPWRPTFGPTTPDGVPLASWGQRLVARLLDNILVSFMALPLTGYFLYRYLQAYNDWSHELQRKIDAGQNPSPFSFPTEMIQWLVPIVVITVLVGFVYEVLMLRAKGATVGKRAMKLAVRDRDVPAIPPAMPLIWKRCAFIYGLQLVYVFPVAGLLVGLLILLDYLWPLWDKKRQALHDKVAGSNVVKLG